MEQHMYSPSRKIHASIRRTISLIAFSCFICLLLIETVLEYTSNTDNQLTPTRSAGIMLNRSQMLLAKEVLLEPSLFRCTSHTNIIRYPLYIIVKTRAISAGNYFQRRMFTRTSWGREAHALGIPVVYAVGRPKDEQVQQMLEYENKIYDDILQFNYIDAYYNISIKTAGILNWFATRHCYKTTPYLFVVDDDVLINIPSLMRMISTNSFQSNTIYGLYLKDIEPHPSGKWAVSLENYPNRTYPDFIIGASTLYPALVVQPLIQELFRRVDRNHSIFFLDDVLITGIIAEQLDIRRAPMFGIEDCSYTDLFARIIISECNNLRRQYVWSKFLLSRLGQNVLEIDQLIQTTTYIKWRGHFKQTRNGTAIRPENLINILENSIFIIFVNSYSRILFIVLFIIMSVVISIFIRKILCIHRQSSNHIVPFSSTSSTMLLTTVK